MPRGSISGDTHCGVAVDFPPVATNPCLHALSASVVDKAHQQVMYVFTPIDEVRHGRARRAAAGYIRCLRYEFFTAILPSRNVNTSQPVTSTRVPSARVPLNVHSERPRSPTKK